MISKPSKKLRIGVAGLGRAFSLMAPAFRLDPRVQLVAAADPRPEARSKFQAEFGAAAFESPESLAGAPDVDAVYIATPHQFHAAQACLFLSAGKHVLVEKPMALSLDECRAMIAAARESGMHLIVGHSHSFDAPVLRARELIDGGQLGAVRMVTALNYTDFLYRPRRPEELDTAAGGGAVFNQAAHQVDIVRLLAGSRVTAVRAFTGAWDSGRPTEGAYSCQLAFADGCFGTLVYSGYAHFDSDEFAGWIGEMGARKDPAKYRPARMALKGDELSLKASRNYGGPEFAPPQEQQAHQHFGEVIVSCERADLRPLPAGVMVYGDGERRLEALPPPRVPRVEVIDELHGAVVHGRAPRHDGEWAMATLEVCLAILRSAREGREIRL
jgi:phthalate 4,5-cis-dihydrodiol dehydrogenase